MLILEQSPDGLALVRRRPRAPVTIAGVLFGALAAVPAVQGAEFTPLMGLTALALGSVAIVLIWLGRPQAMRSKLPPELEKGRVPAPARIELTGYETYQAKLVLSDGTQTLLFERDEPAGVLRDVLTVATRFSVPVRPGFGLGESEWAVLRNARAELHSRPRIDPPLVSDTRPLPRQRTAAYTTVWAGLFVLVVAIAMAVSPYRSGIPPSALSVLLPSLTVAFVLALGAWLWGLRDRVTIGPSFIERQRLWFGFQLGAPERTETETFATFPVSVGAIAHVVVATADGPLAFPADSTDAERLALPATEFGAAAGRAAE